MLKIAFYAKHLWQLSKGPSVAWANLLIYKSHLREPVKLTPVAQSLALEI